MSSLDKNLDVFLERIGERFYWDEYNDPDEVRRDEFPEWRRQIKQAFKDEGWIAPEDFAPDDSTEIAEYGDVQPRPLNRADFFKFSTDYRPLMTGQEWYDRFEKEMTAYTASHDQPMKEEALKAAKKAAGLER